jgi:hypothetical protein
MNTFPQQPLGAFTLDDFPVISIIKCSHYCLTGTSMSQAARRFVFDKIQFYPTLSPIG